MNILAVAENIVQASRENRNSRQCVQNRAIVLKKCSSGNAEGGRLMKWVTRRGVRLDRTACAWLILRHIDPQATIEYVEAEALPDAIEEGALPFHNTVSEDPGTRERTSFQELLA